MVCISMNIHQFGHSSNGDQDEKIGNNTNKPNVIKKKKTQLAGGRPVGYDGAAKEGNSEQSRTNSMSDRVEGLNPGPPDYKPSATTTLPHYVFCSLLFG